MTIFSKEKIMSINSDEKIKKTNDDLVENAKNTIQLATDVTQILKNKILDYSLQLEKVGEMLSDSLIMINEKGIITSANKESNEIFDCGESLVGHQFKDYLILPEDSSMEKLSELISEKNPYPYEKLKGKTKCGNEIDISISISKIILSNMEVLYIAIIRKI